MGDSGDVPGVADQGACAKTARVVGKIGDDDFDDFQGKSSGRGWVFHGYLWGGPH